MTSARLTGKEPDNTEQLEPRQQILISMMDRINEEGKEKVEDYIEILLASNNYRKNVMRMEWAKEKRSV